MAAALLAREARTEQDLAEARALIAAAEAADGVSPVSDQAMLAAAQGQRTLLLFGEEGGASEAGAVVALGVIGQGEVDLVVRPEARGRGLGSAALALLLGHGGDPDGGELRAWAHGENPAAEALLRGAGFDPVRTLLRMTLDPSRLPDDGRDPLALPTPPGLELRAFDPARPGDAGAWVRANAAAFATHPEQGRITEDDFALMRQEPWFDPSDLILLAERDGAELAGSTWIKTVRTEAAAGGGGAAGASGGASTGTGPSTGAGTDTGAVECELYAVGVRPEYAGRGLGRLLLDVTLARMAQHRPDRVSLYVDGENEPAVRLYERAAFTVDSRSRQWARSGRETVDARMEP